MRVWVRPLRFHFRATEAIRWPPNQQASVLRGALGLVLRDLGECPAECRTAGLCRRTLGSICLYQRIFDPPKSSGPSGLAEPPKCFVIRAGFHEQHTSPEQVFTFDVHVFDRDPAITEALVSCLNEIGRRGLGVTRGRAALEAIEVLSLEGEPYSKFGPGERGGTPGGPWELSIQAVDSQEGLLRVHFLTPTAIKVDGKTSRKTPEFAALVARARDRLSTLSRFYGEPTPDFDYKGFLARAESVRLVETKVHWAYEVRLSSRSEHPILGITGSALYEGRVGDAYGLLRAAYWTGVGSQTVWGNGAIRVVLLF